MTDIFLSYSSEDRDRVIPLVEALQADGYSVWWDRVIRPGPSFDREIEAAIDNAGCMIVLWSGHSVESEWVRSEVEEGVRTNLLVPALIDDVLPPLAHRRRQSADLTGWAGERSNNEYQHLLAGIRATLDRTGRAKVGEGHVSDPTATTGHFKVGRQSRRDMMPAVKGRNALLLGAAGLLVGWAVANLDSWTDAASDSAPDRADVKRMVITLQESNRLALAELAPLGIGRRSLALSPDGTLLAYVVDNDGQGLLYLRRMDEFEARPLQGTEGAFGPFFSPDGQWLGFLTETRIMKIAIRGGSPQVVAEAGNVFGASWGPDNKIIFSEREGAQLIMVSGDGTNKQILSGGFVTQPILLPDGKGVLLTQFGADSITVTHFSLQTRKFVPLIVGGSSPLYVPTGHILYTGGSGVMAVPFDLEALSLTGPAVPVLDDVRREDSGLQQLTFSAGGLLAYIPGADMRISKPVWLDRDGQEHSIPLPAQRYGTFSLSPDNSQVAILIIGPTTDIWLYDFQRATPPRRLTVGGSKLYPVWNPDGRRLAFGAQNSPQDGSTLGIYQQAINGGQMMPLVPADTPFIGPNFWTQDGLLVWEASNGSDQDVWFARAGDRDTPKPFANTAASEWGAAGSPDGRFIAYTSDESGQYQVYVKHFPPTDERWMISAGYGEEPIWSLAGDEIFYRRGDEWLSVPVQTDPEFSAGVPQVIFDGSYMNVPGLSYGVSTDAQRFLLLKSSDQPPATRIHVVANWFDELERLAPVAE